MEKPEIITITFTSTISFNRLLDNIPKDSNLSFLVNPTKNYSSDDISKLNELSETNFKVIHVQNDLDIESNVIYINLENKKVEIQNNKLLVLNTKKYTEEKRKSIFKKHEIFREMFDISPIGKSITSHDGKLYVNPKFSEIVGYTEDELNNMSWKDITHPDDVQLSLDAISRLKETNEPVRFRKRYIHKSGLHVWTEVLSVKCIDTVTGDYYYLTSIQDINELLKSENALKKSEERYELASAASDNGIWDWKVGTNEVYYSDQWKAQVGYLPSELENKFSTWENLLHPEDKERMIISVQEFLSNPKDYFIEEFRMIHKDGTPRWIRNRAAAVLDENGNVIRMFGAHNDITVQKEVQEELRKTDNMYRGMIENATDGVVMIGLDGKFKFASNSAIKMFGYSIKEIMSTDPNILTHPDDLEFVLKTLFDTAKNNNPNTIEYRFLHKNGKYLWIESTFSNSFDEDGNPVIVINFRNIEERKENERLLLEAKKQAEEANIHKNYFLANMSHEIRTPMNGVIGFSELLKADNLSKDQRNKYLTIIDSNAKQLLNLIDDIIDIAKIEANQLRIIKDSCNIASMMDEMEINFNQLALLNGKTDIEFKSHYEPNYKDLEIITDCSRLRQTLSNLLNNAMKFTKDGEISFGFEVNDSDIIFRVKDQGIGIPENKIDEIFEQFKQVNYEDNAKFGGTGLGLAICKGIVTLLGGDISVTSELNKGTEFIFSLPFQKAESSISLTNDVNAQSFKLSDKTILIAEDDIVVQFYFKEITSDLQANILFAQNGAEALDMYQKHPEIDLILLDIRMPKLNGFEVMDKIFAIDHKAKIIAQTAYASNNEKTLCINKGCLDYLTKPILKDVFMRTIEKWA